MDRVVCRVEGCDRMVRSVRSGICGTHYARLRTSGRIELRTPVERFWEKVDKTDTCWLWTDRLDANGYARFWVKPRTLFAHRFSFELHRGPIPAGMTIDHRCRVRHCVNPAHLEPETLEQNVRLARSANAAKTLCPEGHALDYVNSNGSRECTVCRRGRIARDSRRRKTLVRLDMPKGIYTVDQLASWLVENHYEAVQAALEVRHAAV
jgi:hypothetical protein